MRFEQNDFGEIQPAYCGLSLRIRTAATED